MKSLSKMEFILAQLFVGVVLMVSNRIVLPSAAALRWGLFAVLLAAGAVKCADSMLNLDVGWFLLEARALDAGKVLYQSYGDINLPSNVWLPRLSLAASQALHATLADVHLAALFVMTALSAALSGWLVTRLIVAPTSLFGMIAPAFFATLWFLYPGYDFGEREEIFVTLATPLLIVVLGRHLGRDPTVAMSLLVSVMAALGASQKPHFMIFLAGLGVIDLLLQRFSLARVTREFWLVGGLLLAYVASIAIVYPTYFPQMIPAAVLTYSSLGSPAKAAAQELTGHFRPFIVYVVSPVALLAATCLLRPPGGPLRSDLFAAWCGMVAFSIALVILQGQGFRYHRFVTDSICMATSAGSIACLLDAAFSRAGALGRQARIVVPCVLVGCAFGFLLWKIERPSGQRAWAFSNPVTQILRGLPPGTPVLALQTSPQPISPLHAYADIKWNAEFGALGEIRSIVDDRDHAAATGQPRNPRLVRMESEMRQRVLRALVDMPPKIVIVVVSQPLPWFETYGKKFGLLDYLSEDPAFRIRWARYRLAGTYELFYFPTVEVYVLGAS